MLKLKITLEFNVDAEFVTPYRRKEIHQVVDDLIQEAEYWGMNPESKLITIDENPI